MNPYSISPKTSKNYKNWGLAPLAWFYRHGVRLRHWMYDQKLLTKNFSALPTISIGNLVAGGAGKTQVALLLAEQLRSVGVAILSRGYRSRAEDGDNPLIVNIKKHSPGRVGDEPWLLSSRLDSDSTFVIVNKDRYKCAQVAEKWGARILILDDGMQHRSLYRDFELVVIDGHTPLRGFLPQGRLREDPNRLKNSDAIFFIGEPEKEIVEVVSKHTNAPQIIAEIVPQGLFDLQGKNLGSLQGKKVGLFCGIGNPARFIKTVQNLDAQVVSTLFSLDHKLPSEKDFINFSRSAQQKGAEMLVCTEKDKVKLYPKSNYSSYIGKIKAQLLPVAWLKVGLRVIDNANTDWQKLIREIELIARIVP